MSRPGAAALDPIIHVQARLRAMVVLASLPPADEITFTRLQELLGLTAGNLAAHLRKLEEAGYLGLTKTYDRRTPVTYVRLTKAGRRAFEDYHAALRDLLSSPAELPGT